MAGKAFFLTALNAHLLYMKRLDAALAGQKEFSPCDDHECTLGKWLFGTGEEEVKALGSEKAMKFFEEIKSPHQQFHEASQVAMTCKAESNAQGVQAALTDMYRHSNKIYQKLLCLDEIAQGQR